MARHHISSFITRRLDEMGITRQQAAAKLGVGYCNFNAIIRRGSIPPKRKLDYAGFFETDVTTLNYLADLAPRTPYMHPRRKTHTAAELGIPPHVNVMPFIRKIARSPRREITMEKFISLVKMQQHAAKPFTSTFIELLLNQ